MTTSSATEASRPLTRSDYVSTLPPWRRLLAMLNWRPVYDIEHRMRLHEQRERERERRTRLLESEIAQLDIEIAQLRHENKRLDALNSRMDALLLSADSSSQTPPATGSS